jgi:hypothetical protein
MSNLGRNVSQCLIDNMATRQTALLALEAAWPWPMSGNNERAINSTVTNSVCPLICN